MTTPRFNKLKKARKRNGMSLSETMVGLIVILIGMCIVAPYLIQKHKNANSTQEFMVSSTAENKKVIASYYDFWTYYNQILTDRAAQNGAKVASLQEIKDFDAQFFGNLQLTVDAATRIVYKKDGTTASPVALTCQLKTFYMDKAYIKPVCPNL